MSRLSPTWETLAAWRQGLGAELTVVLEATLYCWRLEQQLTPAGYRALVVDAHLVKLIWQTRTKTDPIDAQKLAELARVRLLPVLRVPDPQTRTLRQALRGRVFLVRQRTVLNNRIHADLTAENEHCSLVGLYEVRLLRNLAGGCTARRCGRSSGGLGASRGWRMPGSGWSKARTAPL